MEFGILGPLSVWLDETEVPIGAAKQRALLTLLLLRRGEVVPTEVLVDELWGANPPATAVKVVQVYVSQLRKTLGEAAVETRPTGYRLRLDPDALDAARFERLLGHARTLLESADAIGASASLREALALWRGPPLAEFRYESFARNEIARLEELRLGAIELRLETELALGRHVDAVPELESFVREQPLREGVRGLLMLALYRSGRQADALAAYQSARTALVDELGLEPSDSLRQLETAILRHDPALDPPRTRSPAATAAPSDSRRRTARFVAAAIVAVLAAAAAVVVALAERGSGSSSVALAGTSVEAFQIDRAHPVAQILLGASPSAIASGDGSLWVANVEAHSVSRIDPAKEVVIQTIQVGNSPAGIADGGGFVWVSNSLDGTVSQIDPHLNGGQLVDSIGVGNGPGGIAYGAGAVWVANSIDRTVVRIDPRTETVSRPIPVAAGADAIAVGDGAVWVTSESAGMVSRIDPRALSVIRTINVGDGPDAVAVAPGAVWVANGGDATVSRIDPATNEVTSAISVGNAPSGVAVAQAGKTVWVSNELADTLSKIDAATNKAVATLPVGDRPRSVTVNADTAYVAVQGSTGAHRGGTLTVAIEGPTGIYEIKPPASLDPANGYAAWELLALTNDGLMGYARSGGSASYRIVPDLAAAPPTVSDGGLTYTFQVRPGIHYSTGALVRPADFRRGIERALLATGYEQPSSYLSGIVGSSGCINSKTKRCDLSRGITIDPNSDTITFHLSAPDSDFLYKLALPVADAVPSSTPLKAHLPLPATGPYEVAGVDAKRGVIRLVRNHRFQLWSTDAQPDGSPDQIIERYGYTGESAVRAVEHGTADITSVNLALPAAIASSLRTRYSSRLYGPSDLNTVAVWLNTKLPPFNDVRVRQALNDAVDRNHLIDLAGGPELAAVSCQILPPNLDGYRRYCPYTLHPTAAGTYNGPDIAKARRLVSASGTRGQRVTVWFYNIPIGLRNGTYVVSVLRSLGYRARLKTVPHDQYTYRANRQAGVGGWGASYPSANDFFSSVFTCASYEPATPELNNNTAGFCDKRVDAEIARANILETTNPTAASRVWGEIDRAVTEQAPWVVLRTDLAPDFVSARAGNYTYCYIAQGACLDQLWLR